MEIKKPTKTIEKEKKRNMSIDCLSDRILTDQFCHTCDIFGRIWHSLQQAHKMEHKN
jgi:hypothetical protein